MSLQFFRFIHVGILMVCSTFVLSAFASYSDAQENLLQGLKSGNAKEISGFFESNISLTILSESGYYSKFQAEMVLGEFLTANKPAEVKQLQKISNNSSNYYVLYQYASNKKTYRISVKFSKNSGSYQISEMRIE